MKRKGFSLEALCCLVYFTSYITRVNYGAVLSELMVSLDLTKALASMAVTGSFVTYGLGQLLFGWFGDRVEPRHMISFGLVGTALCNALLPFLSSPYPMTALWSCNGFFQSMLWPPLVRILAGNLTKAEYARASARVTMMASVGTLSVYLGSPVFLSIADWRLVFWVPACVSLVVTLLWNRFPHTTPNSQAGQAAQPPRHGLGRAVVLSALPVIIFPIILQGLVRDGVTTWLPVYLTEAFAMENEFSIFISSVLPICSILGISLASKLDTKVQNGIHSAFLLFAIASGVFVLLIPLWNRNFPVVLLLFSLLYAALCGINLLLISRIPPYYLQYGRVSVVSGVLNAFTYVGSSISTFTVGRLAEALGWQAVLIFWGGAVLLGGILCFVTIARWRAFTHPDQS